MPIEDTAETMFRKPDINKLVSVYREIMSIFSVIKTKESESSVSSVYKDSNSVPPTSEYNWTGQHTDIAFVDENGTLNISDIENIQDSELRQNVYSSYDNAVEDGYLKYSDSGNFSLTDKGKKHINSEAFIEQFEKDQDQQISMDKAQIQLSGNSTDLNAFRYTNSIDLNHLFYDDPAKFKRVQNYFESCKKYNFVEINDGVITPTEKCIEYLNQSPEKNFVISKVSPDFINEYAKRAFKNKSAKTAVKKSVKVASKAASVGTGLGTAVTAVIKLTAAGAKKITDNKPTLAAYKR